MNVSKRVLYPYATKCEPGLVKYIKINGLKWAGHVMRMDNWITIRECLTLGQKEKKEQQDLN
jgi:hypothetical protein